MQKSNIFFTCWCIEYWLGFFPPHFSCSNHKKNLVFKYGIAQKELRENKLLSQLQRFYHSITTVMFLG